jgi:hypothetical protein
VVGWGSAVTEFAPRLPLRRCHSDVAPPSFDARWTKPKSRTTANTELDFGGSAHSPRRTCAEPSQLSRWSRVILAGINDANHGAF